MTHRQRRLSRGLALALLLFPGFLRAEELRLDVQEVRLDNGMTFLLVDRPASAAVAAGWVVRAGWGDDPAEQTGLSHLLEHMLYKGTRTIGIDEYDRIYGRAGATAINAFTAQDLTAYFVSVPANRLELWFWMESDRLLAPAFQGLAAEQKVIAEEMRRRDATPTGPFAAQLDALFWQRHPYGQPGFGWLADVESATSEDALRHFRTWYGPGNLTAVLVGHFDRAKVEALARRYFGRLPAAPAPVRRLPPTPAPRAETRMLATCDCPSQIELRYPTAPFLHADADALLVLAGVLNGRAGRLQSALVTAGLASRASAEQSSFERAGLFAVRSQVAKPEVSPEQLEQAWSDVLGRLQREPVPAAELERVQSSLVADAVRRLEDPFFLMVQLLTSAGRGDWRYLQEQPQRIRAVTAADLQRVAQTYFRPESRTVALYRRAAKPEGAPKP